MQHLEHLRPQVIHVVARCADDNQRQIKLRTHSSSRTHTGAHQQLDTLLQCGHRLLPSHGRGVVHKVIQPMCALKEVQKRLHRHTSGNEDGRPPEDFRIALNVSAFTCEARE